MRRVLGAAAGWAVVSATVWANPPVCKQGTLASYIALGASGCILGATVYANFAYSANASWGAAKITANQISVVPGLGMPAAGSLTFSAPWKVERGQTQDSVITYTAVPPCDRTGQAELRLNLGTAQVLSRFGLVEVSEKTNVGDLDVFERCAEICAFKGSEKRDFDLVGVVLITDHVHLGGGSGGAEQNEFTATLDYCPLCC